MADIYAIFGTLLAVGISFPGLLTTWHLLIPERVDRARQRLGNRPWTAFWMGAGVTIVLAFPITLLLALPLSLAKLLGVLLTLTTLALASVGAAGLAASMANHIGNQTENSPGSTGDFVKAAVALELAAAFPLIGWFLIIPLTTIISLGAATLAILNWGAKPEPDHTAQPTMPVSPAIRLDNPTS